MANGRTKPTGGKSTARRAELRKNLGRRSFTLSGLIERPQMVNAALLLGVFLLLISLVVVWSRSQVRVYTDQVMKDTRVNRVDFAVADAEATEDARRDARTQSPRVYRENRAYLDQLEAALMGLPKALEGLESLDEVSEEIRSQFPLTEEMLAAIQPYSTDVVKSKEWENWVFKLFDKELWQHPIFDKQEYQTFQVTSNKSRILPDGTLDPMPGVSYNRAAIQLSDDPEAAPDRTLNLMATRAGFKSPLHQLVRDKILRDRQPTLRFDPEETQRLSEKAVAQVEPVMVQHAAGEVIYARGDSLQPAQYAMLMQEAEQFAAQGDRRTIWMTRLGIAGLVGVLGLFAGVFVACFYTRVTNNPWRVVAVCSLSLVTLAAAAVASVQAPELLDPAAFASALMVAVVLLLAYDQRFAIFVSTVQCALLALALGQGVGWFMLVLATCGVMIAQLHEIRHRSGLIRAAVVTAAFGGVGMMLLGLFETPMIEAWSQTLVRCFWTVGATLGVGFLMLGILPTIEKMFDITTGMTLAELRDTKQPLLRQLQQKAPGTYNHSLQVANIAEAAADAIGANGLLVYVGALYHDIGKMNKPQYFVENQSRGHNKHDRLSPAMSLLVIVGHVKDGIELAKEYNLPRPLQHFIESHHGTTLVEYFYHAAREAAEADDKASVEEVAYRYPGPKPRTKEAAILMLSDAVESATRAMTDPNPARIEAVVKEISHKRLVDGQFDNCPLSFSDLRQIQDAIITRLCAIHHGRISYPTAKVDDEVAAAGDGGELAVKRA